MSFDDDFLAGAATDLATRVPSFSWQPSGKYAANTKGIYLIGLPTSGAAIALALYSLGPTKESDPSTLIGLNVTLRSATADPRDLNAMSGLIYDAWHGLHHATFGSAPVRRMWQQSAASPTQLPSRQWQKSDNYYVRTARPAPASQPF